jgi:hypothetical protein
MPFSAGSGSANLRSRTVRKFPEKNAFLDHDAIGRCCFLVKNDHLPRQALDKHSHQKTLKSCCVFPESRPVLHQWAASDNLRSEPTRARRAHREGSYLLVRSLREKRGDQSRFDLEKRGDQSRYEFLQGLYYVQYSSLYI